MDIDPEKRDGLLEASALAGNETINGLELRPVTSATWSLLSRMRNPFVTGEQNGDYAFAVYSFVYLHSQPLAKIRARIATISQLEADIFEFMDGRPVSEAFAFMPWVTRQVETVAATITAVTGATSAPDADPKA